MSLFFEWIRMMSRFQPVCASNRLTWTPTPRLQLRALGSCTWGPGRKPIDLSSSRRPHARSAGCYIGRIACTIRPLRSVARWFWKPAAIEVTFGMRRTTSCG